MSFQVCNIASDGLWHAGRSSISPQCEEHFPRGAHSQGCPGPGPVTLAGGSLAPGLTGSPLPWHPCHAHGTEQLQLICRLEPRWCFPYPHLAQSTRHFSVWRCVCVRFTARSGVWFSGVHRRETRSIVKSDVTKALVPGGAAAVALSVASKPKRTVENHDPHTGHKTIVECRAFGSCNANKCLFAATASH